MLTELLIQDEMTISLGKTESTLTVHDSGETVRFRELIYQHVTQEVQEYSRIMSAVFRLFIPLVSG